MACVACGKPMVRRVYDGRWFCDQECVFRYVALASDFGSNRRHSDRRVAERRQSDRRTS